MFQHGSLSGGVAAGVTQKIVSAATILVVLAVLSRFLSRAEFGVVGFYVSLQLTLTVFDLGISTSAAHDFARRKNQTARAKALRAYERWIRIFAVTMLVVGIVHAGIVATSVGAYYYLLVTWSCLALELTSRVHSGVLLGEGRQALNALLLGAGESLRWWGACLLVVTTGSLTLFFVWHAVVLVVWLAVMRSAAWRPGAPHSGEFPWGTFRSIGRATLAPVAAATLLGGFRLYADRFYASAALDLVTLGAYTAAFAVSAGLGLLASQLAGALIPRMSQLILRGSVQDAYRLLSQSNIAVGLATTVGGLILVGASEPIARLMYMTGEREDPFSTVLLLAVAAVGLGAVAGPGYALLVAQGRFKVVLLANFASVVLVLVLLAAGPTEPGAIGVIPVFGAAVPVAILAFAQTPLAGGDMRFADVCRTQGWLFAWVAIAGLASAHA